MPRFFRLFAAFILTLLAIPAAWAEALVVSTGPVLADGATQSVVRLYLPDLVEGERFRVKPDEGKAGPVYPESGGVIRFYYSPPAITTPRSVGLALNRRGGATKQDRVELELVPAYAGSLQVGFDPPQLVAGGETAVVRVTPSQDTPQAAEQRRFLMHASAGSLSAAMPSGDGAWVARYTPPSDLSGPRTVIVSAADAAAPDVIIGWGVLPISYKQSVSVQVGADANAILTVGEKSYGPIAASPAGTAAFDVEIDPALPKGRVEAVSPTGEKSLLEVDLPLPAYGRLGFLPLPEGVPADPVQVKLPIRLAVTTLGGAADSGAAPTLHASTGQLAALQASAVPGVYEALYTPGSEPGVVNFTAELDGFKAVYPLELLPPMARLGLGAEPSELPKGKRDFTVTARVQDASGTSLPGRMPTLEVEGASLLRRLRDNGDGTYAGAWRIHYKAAKATILGLPPLHPSPLHAHRLLIWPRRTAIPADGVSRIPVTIAAVDRFGLPVPDVELALAVPVGDAALPPTLRTNKQGLVRTEVTAGQAAGLAILRVQGAGLAAATPIFQVASGQLAPPLEVGGDSDARNMLGTWQAAVPVLEVAREGGPPVAGPPAVLSISTVPPYTTPGAAILVTLRVTDAMGTLLPGQKPKLKSSLGTVGKLTDNGDGSYNVPLQLPAGQDGPLTVDVTVGSVTRSLELSTLAQAGNVIAVAQPGAGASPSATTGGRRAATGAQDDGSGWDKKPWIRFYGGVGTVSHTYAMDGSTAERTPVEASFQNGEFIGGSPALNGALLVRLPWIPLELDASILSYFEMVQVVEDEESNPTMQLRVAPRYRFDLGSTPLYLSGLAGVHHTRALLFRYTDETATAVETEQVKFTGLQAAGAFGLDWRRIWLELEFSATWGAHPMPQVLTPHAVLGVEVKKGLFPFISLGHDVRSLRLESEDGQEIAVEDTQTAFMVGLGGAFRQR